MKAILKAGSCSLAALVAASALSGSAFAGAAPPPGGTPKHVPGCSVPEIDPGSAAGALTLLVGGVMTLVDRRRSK